MKFLASQTKQGTDGICEDRIHYRFHKFDMRPAFSLDTASDCRVEQAAGLRPQCLRTQHQAVPQLTGAEFQNVLVRQGSSNELVIFPYHIDPGLLEDGQEAGECLLLVRHRWGKTTLELLPEIKVPCPTEHRPFTQKRTGVVREEGIDLHAAKGFWTCYAAA